VADEPARAQQRHITAALTIGLSPWLGWNGWGRDRCRQPCQHLATRLMPGEEDAPTFLTVSEPILHLLRASVWLDVPLG